MPELGGTAEQQVEALRQNMIDAITEIEHAVMQQ